MSDRIRIIVDVPVKENPNSKKQRKIKETVINAARSAFRAEDVAVGQAESEISLHIHDARYEHCELCWNQSRDGKGTYDDD